MDDVIKIEELVKELQDKHKKDIAKEQNKTKKAIKEKDKEILKLKSELT